MLDTLDKDMDNASGTVEMLNKKVGELIKKSGTVTFYARPPMFCFILWIRRHEVFCRDYRACVNLAGSTFLSYLHVNPLGELYTFC